MRRNFSICKLCSLTAAAATIQEERQSGAPKSAGPSRRNKRKATTKGTAKQDSSESDGFDDVQMADEERAETVREQEEELAERATPEKSDLDETEDEDTDEPGPAPSAEPSPPSASRRRQGVAAKGKALEEGTAKRSTTATRSQRSDISKLKEPESAPPRRELPFTRGKQARATQEVANPPPAAG